MKRAPILAAICLTAAVPLVCGCTTPAKSLSAPGVGQQGAPATLSQRIGSAFQKTGEAFTIKPRVTSAADPLSLSSKSQQIGPAVFYGAGQMYEKKGDLDGAIGQYEQALAADPNDMNSLVAMARAYSAKGDLNKSVEIYQRALAVKPDDLKSLHELARLYDRQEDFGAATETYRRALAAHPANAVVLNDLGLCYARQGDVPRSMESLSSAVKSDPASKLYRNNLATVLVEAGYPDHALQHFTAAHGRPVAHYNLGLLLYKKGDHTSAARYLRQALQLDPSMQSAHALLARLDVPTDSVQQASSPPSTGYGVAPTQTAAAPPAQAPVVVAPVVNAQTSSVGDPVSPSYAEVQIPDMGPRPTYGEAQQPPQPGAYGGTYQTSAFPRKLPPVQ